MDDSLNITLVGCGKMGSAILRGWLDSDINATFNVIEPWSISDEFKSNPRVTHLSSARDEIKNSHIIVLAVKPQAMAEACEELKPYTSPTALILSIAAGQSLANFGQYFGTLQPVIRAMPNTPAAIGKGMNVMVANPHVRFTQKSQAEKLMGISGVVEWVQDENLMDAVTALSGSGPAYVFLMIEILTKAGEKAGLPSSTAAKLARQTVIGSAALAESEANTSASTLRENVTSPGGTTEAALQILMNGEFQSLFDKALMAAKERGKELSA